MEIDEFLTRIGVKEASPTIFKIEERATLNVNNPENGEATETLKGIKTYTKTEDKSIIVIGFLTYDKPFPEQVFAIPSEDLRNLMAESERIEIQESKLMGYGAMDFSFNLQILDNSKTIKPKYDNDPVFLDKDTIKKILRVANVLDIKDSDSTSSTYVDADGEKLTITLVNKLGNKGTVVIPSKFPEIHSRFENRFVECLKLVGDNDVELNLDGYNPAREHKAHGLARIEMMDSNAIISYYIHEITQKVQESKKAKKEKKEESETPAEE